MRLMFICSEFAPKLLIAEMIDGKSLFPLRAEEGGLPSHAILADLAPRLLTVTSR